VGIPALLCALLVAPSHARASKLALAAQQAALEKRVGTGLRGALDRFRVRALYQTMAQMTPEDRTVARDTIQRILDGSTKITTVRSRLGGFIAVTGKNDQGWTDLMIDHYMRPSRWVAVGTTSTTTKRRRDSTRRAWYQAKK
jgi:hypothetical protein